MYTGWVLLVYAITHLINHAVGIFGLDALEQGRLIFTGFWRSLLLKWVVVTAISLHLLAVLHKLFFKKTFHGLHTTEWVQIVLGLLAVVGLVHHVMETKIAHEIYGIEDTYAHYLFWTPPYYIWVMASTLIIVWCHGSIGLHHMLKQQRWYPHYRMWLLGVLVALPAFAICGILNAKEEVVRLSRDTTWRTNMLAESNPSGINLWQWEQTWSNAFVISFLSVVAVFFAARKLFWSIKTRRSSIEVRYLAGSVVKSIKGSTLLETSLQADIPHAHVCGGRGRCSTCRVQILSGLENLSPPTQDESLLLNKIKGGKAVRLACQARAEAPVTIHPILQAEVSLHQTLWKKSQYRGSDQDVAILFADLRGFTSMSEDKLPYDIVFVLNQYFQFMGQAIESHQGRVDKFIGDAIMAVFGSESGLEEACCQALAAAQSMRLQLDRLNNQLGNELSQPLRMGFGIHCGKVIVGEMGFNDSRNLVAIGDATNTASRLESLTKEYDCELIVSEELAQQTALDFSSFSLEETVLRGRTTSIGFYPIKDIASLHNLAAHYKA